MARAGIPEIDALFESTSVTPIGPDSHTDAVGAVQDLLIGHGRSELPGPTGSGRGTYGPKTIEAVREFRQAQQLPDGEIVDGPTLRTMVAAEPVDPIASQPYLTLVLDRHFTGLLRSVMLSSVFEGRRRFNSINPNQDHAGLSWGIIQWAQRPGRLHEILAAMRRTEPAVFDEVFGGADAAAGLVAFVAKGAAGIDARGRTLDPAFDLISSPWTERFTAAAHSRELQRVQVDAAIAAFASAYANVSSYSGVTSERAVLFMLDLANQFGEAGTRRLYDAVAPKPPVEAELLTALEDLVADQKGEWTRARRQFFRTTTLLSDGPFDAAGSVVST